MSSQPSSPGDSSDRPVADFAKQPAMTDVARIAAVSHQTVSRVVNGHPSVRPGTRARVLAAIEQLGYKPNLAARALVTGRSAVLGVVTLNTTLHGPVEMLYAVEEAARAAGYSVSITTVRSLDRASLRESVSRLAAQAVAGMVVIAPLARSASALGVLPADLPAVVVAADPASHVCAVMVDQVQGARLATRHLLDLGHATVAHVSGPEHWVEASQRVAGWRSALKEAGVQAPEVIVGDWSARSGYEAGRILVQRPEITAVFSANDDMALGLLRAMSEHGRAVPGSLSVVGFDDVGQAPFFSPPLTSVRQDFTEMGRLSVELLIDQLATGVRRHDHVVLGPELVVRESTAHAPSIR